MSGMDFAGNVNDCYTHLKLLLNNRLCDVRLQPEYLLLSTLMCKKRKMLLLYITDFEQMIEQEDS